MRSDITPLTQYANFLVKYGFLATGLLLIFVIAPVVYKSGTPEMALWERVLRNYLRNCVRRA
jgi:hypothetical protein